MSSTYTKLFSSITESTIWVADNETRLCWICMLAMADKYGRVWGSIPGLANRTRISVEGCRKAIAAFLAPDEDSRTKDLDGRRIIEIDGGWQLVNHEKYRAIRDSDERREQVKLAVRRHRENKKSTSNHSNQCKPDVSAGNHSAEAEADTDTDTDQPTDTTCPPVVGATRRPQRRKTQLPHDFDLTEERADGYRGVMPLGDVAAEWAQFCDYHRAKGSAMADWDAAWRTWSRNAAKFNKGNGNGTHQSNHRETAADRVRRANPITPDPELDRYL